MIDRRLYGLIGTFELLARPYLQDCDWMHSVKFQPRLHPIPTQPSVMFPVRMSLILPEASRSTHDAGEERRRKYYSYDAILQTASSVTQDYWMVM